MSIHVAPSTVRIPLFLEVDLVPTTVKADAEHPGDLVLDLHPVDGRILSEDGTILGEIHFGLP